MIVHHRKQFYIGIVLLSSFAILFYFLLTPIISDKSGNKVSGLQYADQIFNELSKGSSWFIPQAKEIAQANLDKNILLNIPVSDQNLLSTQENILKSSAATQISIKNNRLYFTANLGQLLLKAVDCSEMLYNNNGSELENIYHIPALSLAEAWWSLLNSSIKELQKQGHITEAKAVESVLRRAIEPGNNFFGIRAQKVSDNIPVICGFLLFYVLYTVWYGFGVYELFVGLGLMNSSASNEEVLADAKD